MEGKIEIQEVFQTVRKRAKLIISSTLVMLFLGAVITFFIVTPRYEASTQILVNQAQSENGQLSSSDLQSSREVMSTYRVIMTSPAILEPVLQQSNYSGSLGGLRSKIEVSAEEESQVATLTVTETDPQVAVSLANTLAQTFEQEIPGIMEVDNVSILSEAQLEDSENPVSPEPFINLFVSLILGLLIGIGLALLLEYMDKSLKNEDDIEKELGISILGTVPYMADKDIAKATNDKQENSTLRTKNREKGKERKTS